MYYKAYTYKEIARDTSEGVSLSMVKTYLRITQDNTCEDELLNNLISTARQCFEGFTRRTLIETTFKTYRDIWESIYELRRSPLVSITSVQYYDVDNVLQTVDSANYYNTDEEFYSKLIFNNNFDFPTLYEREQAVLITFKAGYADTIDKVPAKIKTALLEHIMAMYENRGDCEGVFCQNLLPNTAKMVYNQYKIEEIGIYCNR